MRAVPLAMIAWLALSACGEAPPIARTDLPADRPANDLAATLTVRPNFVVILADDLGYTDIGAFGGEIRTPHLDALAREGLVFSNFYASPACSPTRAMLMSGMDNHRAGLGNLAERLSPNQVGQPGYEGFLPAQVAALPEVLRAAGYRTYMTGKWHLGLEEGNSPAAAGFDRSFALAPSGASHFSDMLPVRGPGRAIYREDGRLVESLPEDFYSTRFYTERLIEYIDENRDSGQPFFAYLAFTAPHFPLQAPDESIARYADRYDEGYDALHAQRLHRLEQLGLIQAGIEPYPRQRSERPWSELDAQERQVSARRMEIHAAMVDDMDRYIGRLISYLRDTGQYEHTVIVFLSDNGAEGRWLHQGLTPLKAWADECCDNSLENMGRPGSYVMLGANWARAITGPYRMFKGFTTEGGIRVPALLHAPALVAEGRQVDEPVTVMDVMPTLLDLAGIGHPAPHFEDREVMPMQGRSMRPVIHGIGTVADEQGFAMGWELQGKRAYRLGEWKIVWQPAQAGWAPWPSAVRVDDWQLYHLGEDPAELHDLSARHPEKREELIGRWAEYARRNHVILPDRVGDY
ncbi:MAG: arylsulfatase [Gammaproteobacteria bacterium]|nr:arylsulfatase [Gammaproteobacteria bacterium]